MVLKSKSKKTKPPQTKQTEKGIVLDKRNDRVDCHIASTSMVIDGDTQEVMSVSISSEHDSIVDSVDEQPATHGTTSGK
jgi:hypothetical protein